MSATLVERALSRDRLIALVVLAGVTLLAWAWIIAMAVDMYGSMAGASAWTMAIEWGPRHLFLLFAMWAAMMVAMMLPSAAPFLLLYARVTRSGGDVHRAPVRIYALAFGYVVVWSVFSVIATGLQRALAVTSVMTPMMVIRSHVVTGVLLIVAGVYQLTPAKSACLRACRSTAHHLTNHWRPGTGGAFRMGVEHGIFCLGCCWALMLLLFAGGVMNLAVIAGLTTLVLVEKLTPVGVHVARLGGIVLLLFGLWIVRG